MFQIAYDYQKVWPEVAPSKVEIQLSHEITVSSTSQFALSGETGGFG